MQFKDGRRTYYDHDIPYQKIVAKGGIGWDDLSAKNDNDSYLGIEEFLNSPFASFLGTNRNVLDLGCGGGQVALMFARRGCVTHGIDFSPTAISLAKANANKAEVTIDFKEGDCLTLKDYADLSMDLVADNHVWHCIVDRQDRRAFLQAIFRVLKPGGLLFSETMTREGDFFPTMMRANPQSFISHNYSRYWVSHTGALEELKSVGFEILYNRLKVDNTGSGAGDLLVTYGRRPFWK